MKLIPYVQIDGSWSLPDSVMAAIWQNMVDEGTAKTVFCMGPVNSLPDFMTLMKSSSVMTLWENDDPVFIGWINNFTQCSAMVHFNCFKKIWGKRTDEALKVSIKYWFSFHNDGAPLFDTLIGMIAADNPLAINLTKRVGAVEVGAIPDYAVNKFSKEKIGLHICYIKRTEVEAWAE